MIIYIKGYAQRWRGIVGAVFSIMIALLFVFGLFQGKLQKINSQLASYSSESYSLIYLLNYSASADNQCVFADSDIQVYTDSERTNRMTVSGLLKGRDTYYSMPFLSFLNEMGSDRIALCKNVADQYSLSKGDHLYVEFPYTYEVYEYIVDYIVDYNYDFSNPNIDNNIGVVFIGGSKQYEDNVKCKYILFSDSSLADFLSQYSQIIYNVINKSENEGYVFRQGMHIILFQVLITIVAIMLSHLIFFRKSKEILRRCYLKGMKKSAMTIVPMIEKVVIGVIPTLLVLTILVRYVPVSSKLTVWYYTMPIIFECFYSVLGSVVSGKERKR